MQIVKTVASLAFLAAVTHALNDPSIPNCLQGSTRVPPTHERAQYRKVPDGRILAFCFTKGDGATIDNNWVTDLDAMLQRRVDGGACCIDCLPTAAENGCTGNSKIWNIDNCSLGDVPGIDQYTKDAFMDLIIGLANNGQTIEALDKTLGGLYPYLTIDRDGFREQEFAIIGDGDTC
ncbi:uncharacterized protein RCC_03395 [Ramularia collo-cygni]|uniref:Ecp2 effector protein domain-containing protein n=1 Tax=Ramularia collo-cygni TaxID=112498 RepID=A0A2D3UPW6_9PEZI|nr:uncharacterized protein RCC_03395 [Ramularia collo-cygni]CZT17561.1 uncharacterized protein RCC_03395 [Ramularia collo-cygni]